MKIRWTAGSVRLRISPTELSRLERGEPLEERLGLPGGAAGGRGWVIVLAPGSETSAIAADGNVVRFDLGRAEVARLSDPTIEGVYCQQPADSGDGGDGFSFYVEKDFPCIHPRPSEITEPETETFAPPVGFAERKA